MYKKALAALIALILALSSLPLVFAQSTPTVTVSSAAAAPGSTVTLNVSLSDNPGINTFSFGFDYDTTRLQLLDVTPDPAVGGQFAYSTKAVWLNSSDTTYNGNYLNLTFKVLANAAAGSAQVTVTYNAGDISNYNEDDVNFAIVPGTVTVTPPVSDSAITVGTATAAPGAEVTVPVSVSNNPGFNTFVLGIAYDTTRLSLNTVTVNPNLGGQFTYANKAVWLGGADTAYNGEILSLTFTVLQNAPEGDAYVNVTYNAGDISNYNEDDVNFAVVPGKITVINVIAPSIVTQPVNAVVAEGSRAYFHVVASGADLAYRWQYSSDNGKTWKNSTGTGATTADLDIAGSAANAKLRYRCVISNAAGSVTTDTVRVILTAAAPTIVTQPVNATVVEGSRAYFHVVASGADLTYQWQYSKDNGKTWKNSTGTGATTADLDIAGSAANANLVYRCVIGNAAGSVTTDTVRVILTTAAPSIVTEPVNAIVSEGSRAYFHVEASGENLTYQWQYSTDNGKTWKNSTAASAVTADLDIAGSASNAKLIYRCVIRNAQGMSITDTVCVILLTAPVITGEPVDATVIEGERAYFHVDASGTDLTYQWQFSSNNGRSWYNSNGQGATTADLSVAGSASNTKYLYRCVIRNAAGMAITETVRVILLTAPVITGEPVDATVIEGERAYFHVDASGTDLTYQWQFSSNNGRSWYNSTGQGATTADLSVAGSASNTKYLYRCVISNAAGMAITDTVRVVLTAATPSITSQPVNTTVFEGERAYFHVVASGSDLTYQWQYSTDNGKTWKNSTAATAVTPDLDVAGSAANARLLYHCVISNEVGFVITGNVRVILADA